MEFWGKCVSTREILLLLYALASVPTVWHWLFPKLAVLHVELTSAFNRNGRWKLCPVLLLEPYSTDASYGITGCVMGYVTGYVTARYGGAWGAFHGCYGALR